MSDHPSFKVRSNRPTGYIGLDKLDVTTPGGKQITIRFVQGSSGISRSIVELVQEIAKEMNVTVESTSTTEIGHDT